MRIVLIVAGLLIEAMGLLWIGQGLGVIRWPASSFMIDQKVWSAAGIALVIVGSLLLFAALRRRG